MTGLATARRRLVREPRPSARPLGLPLVFAAEMAGSVLGFAALLHQARRLGPEAFGRVEYAAAVLGWLLVVVRGGCDQVAYREAARRPRLVARWTDLLIGVRCLASAAAYALLLAAGASPLVRIAGLALFASAWTADVGPRATGRLAWVAAGQASRAVALLASVLIFVHDASHVAGAAAAMVIAEGAVVLAVLGPHVSAHGWPRPVVRRRATLILLRRGAVAGLARFGRVTLYAADLLVAGACLSSVSLGAYGASRRLVFALAALGLVVPSTFAPLIGRAWAEGRENAQRSLGEALGWLWAASLPAAVGLALAAGPLMTRLFGPSYSEGSFLLGVFAARLPWLLTASLAQAALVACRREDLSLRLIGVQAAAAVMAYPLAANSAPGLGWAACGVEMVGAVVGWGMLRRLGAAPGALELVRRSLTTQGAGR